MARDKSAGEEITTLVLQGIGHGISKIGEGIGRIVERLTQPQFLLSLLSALLLWWLTRELISGNVPESMREVVSVLVGFITGQMVGPGWQFYFGTTKAAAEQTSALAHNAKTLRDAGLDLGSGRRAEDKVPTPVIVNNPYAGKTDDELRQLLTDRGEKPLKSATPDEMIARLTELDAAIPTQEPNR